MKIVGVALMLVSTMPSPAAPLLEERRTYYASGKPYEVRHFLNGREEGVQQVWAEDGTLYINYDMRGGRRYGMINARPCAPVKEAK